MTIRAHLDDHFARQFGGLPQIEPPAPLADDEAQHEAESGLFAEGDECAS